MISSSDDAQVVAQILARDRRALSQFYRRYSPQLMALLRRKVANPEDAEEILQDTLFAFLESLRDFQGNAKLKTFLFSICHHKIIDFYRRRKISQVVFSRAAGLEKLVSPILNPEEVLDAKILKEKIRMVLGSMIPQYRQVLVSKYVDDLSVADIAKKFALSFKSAESQLFRARKAFVELFLSI